MSEADVALALQQPWTSINNDSEGAAPDGVLGRNHPHPRAYGTNSRVLGEYVRKAGIIRLEEAIRRMTSLPAQKFQLHDRGLLRPGMAADVVVFDEKTVADISTFQKPHAYAVGFRYVLVNGRVTVDEGSHNGTRAGQVLRGISAR